MAEKSAAARYTAEFVGTFILVLTIGCNIITGQPVWGGVSIASALTVMIYAFGAVSGANFNPAVSFALGLAGKLEWAEVAIYSVVQLIAGTVAGFVYMVWFKFPSQVELEPTNKHAWLHAGLAETLYTFMLCFVVLNVAASKANAGNRFFGLAIGFVIVAGAYGAGAISMGCFNPAVALGIDLSSHNHDIHYCLVYAVFEYIGAVLAAGLFFVCRPDELSENSASGSPTDALAPKVVSEFLGTYMLVLTVGLNVLAGSQAAAFSIAASLMCMIFALGSVSGAHFNPAVTATLLLSGRGVISAFNATVYVFAQLVGGLTAAWTYSLLMNGKTFALGPSEPYSLWQACMAEFSFTFVLAIVVLSVATVKKPLDEYFGLAIGSCVTVGGVAIGKVSGGSLNPAVSFGIAMTSGSYVPLIAYVAAEVAAGVLAATVFAVTHPSEHATDEEAPLVAKEKTWPYSWMGTLTFNQA